MKGPSKDIRVYLTGTHFALPLSPPSAPSSFLHLRNHQRPWHRWSWCLIWLGDQWTPWSPQSSMSPPACSGSPQGEPWPKKFFWLLETWRDCSKGCLCLQMSPLEQTPTRSTHQRMTVFARGFWETRSKYAMSLASLSRVDVFAAFMQEDIGFLTFIFL